jgi:hypothetical protein
VKLQKNLAYFRRGFINFPPFFLTDYLFLQHLTSLCAVAAECVSALAVDSDLQMHLLQAGVLWHLLIFLFDYDFTLVSNS